MDKSSNHLQRLRLQKAVRSAIWSVTAEGLRPTRSAMRNLQRYASGEITVAAMRKSALENARTLIETKSPR